VIEKVTNEEKRPRKKKKKKGKALIENLFGSTL
jgi:hypothetical protein